MSYASFKSNIEKVEAVAKVFPIFFFLVAALVVLTTMTRMWRDERLQIGTMKALGYGKARSRQSMSSMRWLLRYPAELPAGDRGDGAAHRHLECLRGDVPVAEDVLSVVDPALSLIACGTAVLCTLAATLNACWAVLHQQPAGLMRPRAPQPGKRILLERIGFSGAASPIPTR